MSARERMPVGEISGIVCEKGGVTAHVAILAKALDIPALMGVRGITEKTSDGDELIVDCHAELVYIRPAEHVKAHFRDLAVTRNVEERPVEAEGRGVPARDGVFADERPLERAGACSMSVCHASRTAVSCFAPTFAS